jgi:hypothetical protein
METRGVIGEKQYHGEQVPAIFPARMEAVGFIVKDGW